MRPVPIPRPVESRTEENRLKSLKEQTKGFPVALCNLGDQHLLRNTVFHRESGLQ